MTITMMEAAKTTKFTAYQRGYVSRKTTANDQLTVHTGRKGRYILTPCFESSQYCVRLYF